MHPTTESRFPFRNYSGSRRIFAADAMKGMLARSS
jgi:hypothetical protein